MMAGGRSATVQAWVELAAEDPEAVSALTVARRTLPAARGLESVRRARVIELHGRLPRRSTIEGLLHRSTRFYNPHKERCVLRVRAKDPAPVKRGEQVVLVEERQGARRREAERWWRHETGKTIEVREAVAWVLRFAAGTADPAAAAAELAIVEDRRHGLFCNPHSQRVRLSESRVAVRWLTPEEPDDAEGEGA